MDMNSRSGVDPLNLSSSLSGPKTHFLRIATMEEVVHTFGEHALCCVITRKVWAGQTGKFALSLWVTNVCVRVCVLFVCTFLSFSSLSFWAQRGEEHCVCVCACARACVAQRVHTLVRVTWLACVCVVRCVQPIAPSIRALANGSTMQSVFVCRCVHCRCTTLWGKILLFQGFQTHVENDLGKSFSFITDRNTESTSSPHKRTQKPVSLLASTRDATGSRHPFFTHSFVTEKSNGLFVQPSLAFLNRYLRNKLLSWRNKETTRCRKKLTDEAKSRKIVIWWLSVLCNTAVVKFGHGGDSFGPAHACSRTHCLCGRGFRWR